MSEYRVANMRFILPSTKVAEKNPDRFGTVYGDFADANGNTLTIASKIITTADAANATTVIDITKGILILPSGSKGRPTVASASQADITAKLNLLRNPSK